MIDYYKNNDYNKRKIEIISEKLSNFTNFNDIIQYISQKFQGQFRKFSKQPAVTHSLKVAELIHKVTKDNKLTIIALLHDVLEDTKTDWNELKDKFGEEIAKSVQKLTINKKQLQKKIQVLKNKEEAKAIYLISAMLKMDNSELLIKLADRLSNLLDLKSENLKEFKRKAYETYLLLKNLKKARILTTVQKYFVDLILELINKYAPEVIDSPIIAEMIQIRNLKNQSYHKFFQIEF